MMLDDEIWDQRERDAVDLRRHWRALGLWRSWRAVMAWQVGQHLIGLGIMLISNHASRETLTHGDRLCTSLSIDTDIANEGLQEAKELTKRGLGR